MLESRELSFIKCTGIESTEIPKMPEFKNWTGIHFTFQANEDDPTKMELMGFEILQYMVDSIPNEDEDDYGFFLAEDDVYALIDKTGQITKAEKKYLEYHFITYFQKNKMVHGLSCWKHEDIDIGLEEPVFSGKEKAEAEALFNWSLQEFKRLYLNRSSYVA